MARWAAWVLGALLVVPFGLAQSGSGSPSVVIGGAVLVNSPIPLRVAAAPADNVLVNGAFSEASLEPWKPTTSEVGNGGKIALQSGAVRLAATSTPKSGHLFVLQTFTKPSESGTAHVQYRAQDVGADPMTVAILLRERHPGNNTIADTQITHALTRSMDTYDFTWTPKTSAPTAQFILRVRAETGKSQAAVFDDVSVREGPFVRWEAPNGTVLSSGGYAAKVRFTSLGEHVVRATAHEGSASGPVLWQASRIVGIANAGPVAALASSPPRPDVLRSFLLDATGTVDPDGGMQLVDPTFSDYKRTWTLSASETGGSLTHTRSFDADGRSLLQLAVHDAVKNGSAHASQTIPLHSRDPAFFSVKASDSGDIVRHEVIVRERNATASKDTRFAAAATKGGETVVSGVFTPSLNQSDRVQVFLRFLVAAGKSGTATYTQPTLQSGLTYAWSLDGQPLGSGPQAVRSVTLRDLRAHNASVTVTDKDGATSTATLTLKANDAGYDWRIDTPRVLPAEPDAPLDASRTQRQQGLSALRNGDFATRADWQFRDTETLGGGRWEPRVEDGRPYARVTVDANKTGTVWLQQDTGLQCLSLDCALTLQARTVSGEPTFDILLRSKVQAPGANATTTDQHVKPVVGAQWTTVAANWSVPQHATGLQVFLRFRVEANESATVDFRDVRLAPALTFSGSLRGPGTSLDWDGPLVTPDWTPGRYTASFGVVDPYGLNATTQATFAVLPVSLFPLWDGGLGIRHDVGQASAGNATLALLDADRKDKWSMPLGAAVNASAASQRGIQLAALDGGQLVRVPGGFDGAVRLSNGSANATLPGAYLRSLMAPAIGDPMSSISHFGGSTSLRVAIPVADDSLRAGTATLTLDGKRVATQPLAYADGNLTATFRLGLDLADREFVVTHHLEDLFGGNVTITQSGVDVERNPVILSGLVILVVVPGLVGAGVVARVLRRRKA